MNAHFIEAPYDRARLNEVMSVCPAYLIPIFAAGCDRGVGLLLVPQRTAAFRLPTSTKAAVVLVGDDTDRSLGPDGFHRKSVDRAIQACHAFAVVSSEALESVYSMVAYGAAISGRAFMLVETRPEHELQWLDLIQQHAPGRPLLVSTVKGGHA